MDEALRGAPKNWGKWGEEYTAAPLKVNEASGSPVNPLVIK